MSRDMDGRQATEAIKRLIIECELPRTEMALFGVLCPYCGKTDRIRRLDPPSDLEGVLRAADFNVYKELWHLLVANGGELGFCRFCLTPLRLNMDEGLALPACE